MGRQFTCHITHYHDSCLVVNFSPYKYSLELAAKRLNNYCVHDHELQADCMVKADKYSAEGFVKITSWGTDYCKIIKYLVESLATNSNTFSFAQPLWKILQARGIKFEKPLLLQLQETRKTKSKRRPCQDELIAIQFKRVRGKVKGELCVNAQMDVRNNTETLNYSNDFLCLDSNGY